MGTDAVLSGASQRADAHHRRFSRSPRLASLILSSSLRLPPHPLPHALLATISPSPSSNSRVARRRPSASPCRLFGYVCGLCVCQRRNPSLRCLGLCRPRVCTAVYLFFPSWLFHFSCCFSLVSLSLSLSHTFFLFLSLFSSFYPLSLSSCFLFLFSPPFVAPLARSLSFLLALYGPKICQTVAISERTSGKVCALETARGSRATPSQRWWLTVNLRYHGATKSARENGEPRDCLAKGRSRQQIHERWRLSTSQDQDQEKLVLARGVVIVARSASYATMLEQSRLVVRHAVVSR